MNFFGMKQMFLAIMAVAFSLILSQSVASAQSSDKELTPADIAASEADRLAGLLDLEAWQVFYVDSTLSHDYTQMQEEMMELQNSKVSNVDIYMVVRDKWSDKIDESFKKYFTEEQWNLYLRNGAAKAQKSRAKRAEKREKSAPVSN